jgi:hypothetical protein
MKKPVKIESLIKKWQVKTSAETDDRILADALAALENSTACDSLRPERSIIISRLAKLACAAVIVLAGLLGGYYLSTGVNVSSIAWAQVAKEVGRIETFTYHLETDITAGSPSQTHHAETQFFFSSLYGIRLQCR